MQSESGQLHAIQLHELLAANRWLLDDTAQRAVVRLARPIDDAGQVRQEGRELLLHLLPAELAVRVLQAVVGHEICGTGQLGLGRRLLHQVEGSAVHDGRVLAQGDRRLEGARAVLPGHDR